MRHLANLLLVVSAIACLRSLPASAQTPGQGCVNGRVFDAATGTDLAANLSFSGPDETVRQVSGEFRICDLFTGDYRVMAISDDHLRQYFRGVNTCLSQDCDAISHYQQATTVAVGSGSEPRLDFSLERGGSISGVITAESGNPIAGAQITIYLKNSFGGYSDITNTTSGLDGRYRVPAGLWGGDQYRVMVQAAGYYGAINGTSQCDPCTVWTPGPTLSIVRGAETRSDFVLRSRRSVVSGTVTDRFNGQPLAGALVAIWKTTGGSETLTDANGNYRLEVTPGPFRVIAEMEGYGSQVHPCQHYCRPETVAPMINTGGSMQIDFSLSRIQIWSVSPQWSSPRGGDYARLDGLNLGEVVELRLDGRPIPFRAANSSFIGFVLPAHEEGSVDLTVRDSAGREYTLPNAVTYWPGSVPRRIRDVEPGRGSSDEIPPSMSVARDLLFFSSLGGHRDRSNLWRSDGTPPGTQGVRLFDPPGGFGVTSLAASGTRTLFLSGTSSDLWITDGSQSGTRRLRTSEGSALTRSSPPVPIGGNLLFGATDSNGNRSFWLLRPGADIPVRLADVDMNASIHDQAVEFAGQILFLAIRNDDLGLWVTDGTPGGTQMVRILIAKPEAGRRVPVELTPLNGRVFYSFPDNLLHQLFETDGTAAGTKESFRLPIELAQSAPRGLTHFNGYLYFQASTPSGHAIFKSDGTLLGTTIWAQGHAPLVQHNGWLYFGSASGLMATDGIETDLIHPVVDLGNLSEAGGRLWFSSQSQYPCYETAWCAPLWTSDGSSAGTRPVPQLFWRDKPFEFRGEVCMSALDQTFDAGLWCVANDKRDPRLVWDYKPHVAPTGSDPAFFVSGSGRAYFAATTAHHGRELWSTNLTERETVMLVDAYPGLGWGFQFDKIVSVGDIDYFTASIGFNRPGLWVTRGTPESTQLVQELDPSSGPERILFSIGKTLVMAGRGASSQHGGLWTLDTSSGSVSLVSNSMGSEPIEWRGKIVWAGKGDPHGCVICVFDPSDRAIREAWKPSVTRATEPVIDHLDVLNGDLYARLSTWQWEGLYRIDTNMTVQLLTDTIEQIHGAGSTLYAFDVRENDANRPLRVVALDSTGNASEIGRVGEVFAPNLEVVVAGSRIYFSVRTGLWSDRSELWTAANGTMTRLRDDGFTMGDAVGTEEGLLFFAGWTGLDAEVWRSDGTPSGTELAWQVNLDGSSDPSEFALFGSWLLFAAESPEGDREPWTVRYKSEPKRRPASRR